MPMRTEEEKAQIWARMNHPKPRICPVCEKPLTGRSIQKYCSAKCRCVAYKIMNWRQRELIAKKRKDGPHKKKNFLADVERLEKKLGKDYGQTMAAVRQTAQKMGISAQEAAEWMVQHD